MIYIVKFSPNYYYYYFFICPQLVNGSTGEGTSLTIEERKKVTEIWAGAVKETKQHLMIQVGGASLKDVKELVSIIFIS